MYAKLKAFWNSLSHVKQASILAFASAAGATLIHAAEDSGISTCATWACFFKVLKDVFTPHMIFTALFAGGAALKLFYMLPNRTGGDATQAQAAKAGDPTQGSK